MHSQKQLEGGPFESVDWMFSRRSFYGGDVGSFDCLIRFMTGKPSGNRMKPEKRCVESFRNLRSVAGTRTSRTQGNLKL